MPASSLYCIGHQQGDILNDEKTRRSGAEVLLSVEDHSVLESGLTLQHRIRTEEVVSGACVKGVR